MTIVVKYTVCWPNANVFCCRLPKLIFLAKNWHIGYTPVLGNFHVIFGFIL